MGVKKIDEAQKPKRVVLTEEMIDRALARLAQSLPRADGFLSLEDAARFLGNMPVETLAQKARQGMIKSFKPGKHLLFDPKDLREYVRRFPVG